MQEGSSLELAQVYKQLHSKPWLTEDGLSHLVVWLVVSLYLSVFPSFNVSSFSK